MASTRWPTRVTTLCSIRSCCADARYHKICCDPIAVKRLTVDLFVEGQEAQNGGPPSEIILDLDATDDPVHGEQEGRFFSGYYDCYCNCGLAHGIPGSGVVRAPTIGLIDEDCLGDREDHASISFSTVHRCRPADGGTLAENT
jgi:hypothetical protein